MCQMNNSLHWHILGAPKVTNVNLQEKGRTVENCFTAMVVDLWNSLDKMAVTAEAINGFKNYQGKLGY